MEEKKTKRQKIFGEGKYFVLEEKKNGSTTIGPRGPKKQENEGIKASKNNVGMPKMTC